MAEIEALPQAARPLVGFATRLRRHGFPVAPEQTQTFVAAVGLLGPRAMSDIHGAALATFAPPPDRRAEFDALYRAHFLGQTIAAQATSDEEPEVVEPEEGEAEAFEPEEENRSGAEATAAEALSGRAFASLAEAEALRRFRRAAPAALPRRTSRRLASRRKGDRPDMRRALKDAVRRDGEVVRLPALKRRTRQRRVLLLIDVSGSMSAQTDAALRFAHALARSAEQVEIFTVGTRLTRITRPIGRRRQEAALAAASAAVSDWDGGTRLGDALAAFLAVPRYAGFARGAAVVVLSDGLERGDPAALIAAMERLSRLAWGVVWLSPLAADPNYEPRTAAMAAIRPMLARLGDGSSPTAIAAEILGLARAA
ncbi:VWA domain-containing protein [Acuticoccus sp. I52.16.1]|uniref:vWA domain-containing protein n=1 Tax=Acuticoccus sp. I52.16.1 TaxID=2928472 RepID=UPI001FD1A23E|nr:VWA domain-containing protein [Acuticoccus sp. I52.16.1]UOM34965.1 VWA domain-containing protein [Acuticoccus sp. I52.16.1]